ncbi:1007_t:CDS:2 [Acaulospora morrowiae]|uniref:1007_t:CDS:1 n=1 Tax=Acaulospora morrowiae TaxID=94023 RepID=A0A9N8W3G7_9GLOM|nr:1007_t:CDS:2 [Acaulospora morrowiae]
MQLSYTLIRTILCLMMLHVYESQKIYSMSINPFSVTCELSNLTNYFIDRVEGLLYIRPSDYLNTNISWIGYINCNNSKDIIRDIFSAQSNKAMAVVLFPVYEKPCDVHLPKNISIPIFFETDAECKNFIFNTQLDRSPNAFIDKRSDDKDNKEKNKIIIIIFIIIAVIFGQIVVCVLKSAFCLSILADNESSNVRNNRSERNKDNGITNTVLNSFPVYLYPRIEDDTSNDLEKGKCKELMKESDQSHNVGRELVRDNSIMIDDEILEIHKQSTCPICLNDFVPGEELRILPCNHQYHR